MFFAYRLECFCSVNLNALSQRLLRKACCMATSNELFNVLMLHPLSIGSDLCYSLQDRKSYSLKVYGNPWNHFRLFAGSSSCWPVVTFLCQAPRQRDNSELTLLALFLQHHGVAPSIEAASSYALSTSK
ncbi:hypothetical protein PMIT1318_01993 [Prochlorococcus marinus str. MIT 1318]|nr:hypothetical protein PMIT1318_01993 [Prochlorococcus marinus str. MIT 1318]